MTETDFLFYLGVLLFSCGLLIVFTKKNALLVLMGIELMLNAANLNLVVFNKQQAGMDGQLFALFVILVAVCEAAVGIAIILRVYHYYQSAVPDRINNLKEHE
ncbi:MAG: NADH-quinone oxidoreductase subunit NuoK [Bacteroidetes bacterium CHB5]|nr:NADH-quinone oxidoreductase subunit NuoK [Bacteroidetes bacterium CHB5]